MMRVAAQTLVTLMQLPALGLRECLPSDLGHPAPPPLLPRPPRALRLPPGGNRPGTPRLGGRLVRRLSAGPEVAPSPTRLLWTSSPCASGCRLARRNRLGKPRFPLVFRNFSSHESLYIFFFFLGGRLIWTASTPTSLLEPARPLPPSQLLLPASGPLVLIAPPRTPSAPPRRLASGPPRERALPLPPRPPGARPTRV